MRIMRNDCIDVVIGELNRVRARHFVDHGDGGGRTVIRWVVPGRAPRTTIIDTEPPNPTSPARARADVRAQLKRIGALTTGTGSDIRAWNSDARPLSPSPPRLPVQVAIDAIADRIARLSLFGRDPTRFASERSEIVAALRRLARG
jgi:hypothetical protein